MNESTAVVSDLIEQIVDNVYLLHQLTTEHEDLIYCTPDETDLADALVNIVIAFEEGTDDE